MDLVSGKGRALLYAERYGLRSQTGVEFIPELHQVSVKNIENYERVIGRTGTFKLINMGAVEYHFPLEDLVLFLYNPFVGEVLSRVLANLALHMAESNCDIWVIYRNPKERRRLEEMKLFERTWASPQFCIYHINPSYRANPDTTACRGGEPDHRGNRTNSE